MLLYKRSEKIYNKGAGAMNAIAPVFLWEVMK